VKLLLKNLLFTAVVPGTAAVLAPLSLRPRGPGPGPFWLSSPWLWLALPFFLAGATIYAWTVINFARIGRGTPAPIAPPRRLVVQGPHRYVRNPMYLAVLSVVAGWAILFRSPAIVAYGAALGLGFHLFVRFVEEPALRRQFGDEYLRYCTEVRRWLPGRTRGRGWE
jgi:protein-S-isoprenylcysteine O-methyltransferase Ste14